MMKRPAIFLIRLIAQTSFTMIQLRQDLLIMEIRSFLIILISAFVASDQIEDREAEDTDGREDEDRQKAVHQEKTFT